MGELMTISIESDDSFARVTLNRPERRNAIDGRMVTELREAFERLAREQSLRGIVLAAAGSQFDHVLRRAEQVQVMIDYHDTAAAADQRGQRAQ